MTFSTHAASSADNLSLHALNLHADNDHAAAVPPALPQASGSSTPAVFDSVTPRANAQELALRKALGQSEPEAEVETEAAVATTSTAVVLAAPGAAEAQQLARLLEYTQFKLAPFKDGENDHEIDAIASQRAHRMHARGDTAEHVEELLSFSAGVDAAAHDASGASGATGFALANVIGSHVPDFVNGPARQGAVSGVFTYVLLHLFGNVNNKMTEHTPWGKPKAEDLEPAIAAVLERRDPTEWQNFKNTSINFQAFPATFMASGLVNSALTLHSPATAALAKKAIGPLASLGGGAIVAQLTRNTDLRQHRIGDALVLASTNWEDHLDGLQQQRFWTPVANGGKQLATNTHQKFVDGLSEAASQAMRPSTWLKMGGWVGGMALNSYASAQVTKAMQDHGFSEGQIFTAQQAMFAALLSPTTLYWTSLIAYGDHLDAKAKQAFVALCESINNAVRQNPAGSQRPAALTNS